MQKFEEGTYFRVPENRTLQGEEIYFIYKITRVTDTSVYFKPALFVCANDITTDLSCKETRVKKRFYKNGDEYIDLVNVGHYFNVEPDYCHKFDYYLALSTKEVE